MTRSLFTEIVVLLNRETTGRDSLGNDVHEWAEESWPAWIEQRNGSEQQEPSEQSVANSWMYLPLEAPLRSTTRVRYDGRTWEVDGEPGRQPGGFVTPGYQLVAIRKVTG